MVNVLKKCISTLVESKISWNELPWKIGLGVGKTGLENSFGMSRILASTREMDCLGADSFLLFIEDRDGFGVDLKRR